MNQDKFIEELSKINILLNNNQLELLDKYYNLLIEYNKVMNLTGIIEKDQVYLKHFYDSLTIYKIMNLKDNLSLCDIGSGAGFPGIVLKIVFPNLKITLLDSLGKRIDFLNVVIKELNLKDIEALKVRAEEFSRDNIEKYDIVTARAVAQLPTLLEYGIPMLKVNGNFIAMKSNIEEELNNSKNALVTLSSKVVDQIEFLLPYENSKRTLVKIEKLSKTNEKYPRLNSEIAKKSL